MSFYQLYYFYNFCIPKTIYSSSLKNRKSNCVKNGQKINFYTKETKKLFFHSILAISPLLFEKHFEGKMLICRYHNSSNKNS